uniref:Uncharacterized protein n=1 Tax=Rhizophagus irregularis (strain DAOM 181602 / DAOM 197198 / MUCL 43194) TaxID=747089 RepID=U9UUL4_RHIID
MHVLRPCLLNHVPFKQYKPDHTWILFGEESEVFSSTSKKTVSQISSAVSPDL